MVETKNQQKLHDENSQISEKNVRFVRESYLLFYFVAETASIDNILNYIKMIILKLYAAVSK